MSANVTSNKDFYRDALNSKRQCTYPYKWFARGFGGGGWGGGVGQEQPTGNLTFSGFQMSIFPPLELGLSRPQPF